MNEKTNANAPLHLLCSYKQELKAIVIKFETYLRKIFAFSAKILWIPYLYVFVLKE